MLKVPQLSHPRSVFRPALRWRLARTDPSDGPTAAQHDPFPSRKVAIRSWGRYVPWPVVQNLLVAGVAVQTQLEEREAGWKAAGGTPAGLGGLHDVTVLI